MSSSRPTIEAFESRRLFSFASLDGGFGKGGVVAVGPSDAPGSGSGPLMPTLDGGSVVQSASAQFRRLDAKGKPVTIFGRNGLLVVKNATEIAGAAVDRTSGRLALIVLSKGDVRALNFYSKNGQLERSIPQSALPAIDLRSTNGRMTFDGSGRLIIATETQVARVTATTGTLDASFAHDGIYELPDIGGGLPRVIVAADGGVMIVRSYSIGSSNPSSEDSTSYRLTIRLSDAGTPIGRFGTGGTLQEEAGFTDYESNDVYYRTRNTTMIDAVILSDGSVVRLMSTTSDGDYNNGPRRAGFDLFIQRVSTNGFVSEPVDLDGVFRHAENNGGQLLVDAGDRAYVIYGGKIVRLDGRSLTFDEAYNGTDGVVDVPLTLHNAASAQLDRNGRLLLLGNVQRYDGTLSPASIVAISGSSAGIGGAGKGPFTLTPGGVLDVSGTGGKDDVRLRRVAGKLEVNVNGKTKRYSFADITGIVIHTGGGDDNIRCDVSGMFGGATIQGGAGKDRISGTNGSDLIEGGDGNDYVDGRRGDDVLIGGLGRDTLRGSEGGDRLFGGSDIDTLWASNDKGVNDDSYNALFGGGAKDIFVASLHWTTDVADRVEE